MHAAQICLNEEEMPSALLPVNNSAGTAKPIRGPATYQGQGCFKMSGIIINLEGYTISEIKISIPIVSTSHPNAGFSLLSSINLDKMPPAIIPAIANAENTARKE